MVEWWHIKAMTSYGFKKNYVILTGLHHCSYYPTCPIAWKFGDCQGVPCDNGSYHTLALTTRLLGRLTEAWPQRVMNKDIHFPQFLNPTLGYNN